MRLWVSALLLVVAVGCDGEPSADPELPTKTLPAPTTGPYVSVAVDNHFHDVHPEDHVAISGDRAFVVRNEGSNLHNVTFIGTEVSEDIAPAESIEFDPIGETLEPGTYQIFCKYHGEVGMTGEITVEPAD